MREYLGNGVSKGIAIGPVYVLAASHGEPAAAPPPAETAEEALAAYEAAVREAGAELRRLENRLEERGLPEAKIFAAQAEILQDEAMDEEIRDSIAAGAMPGQAIEAVYGMYEDLLGRTEDPLIRERAADLRDVRGRLLRRLAGVEERSLAALEEPVILVAHDLLPSDTAALERDKILAIVTETGGATSHSAIIARSYEIPAVLGVRGLLAAFREGEQIIVDALRGAVLADAPEETLAVYEKRQAAYVRRLREEKQFLHVCPTTADGVRIETALNIGSGNEQDLTCEEYADGVGLFRTEFLYMNREQPPDEEEQYQIYRKVLERFGRRPVTLRTLDIGGDKQVPCLPLPREQNPFLGNRALRFCLAHEELFLTQLRAALRASVHGSLWIMFPMVGSMDDLRRAKAMVLRAGAQLQERGLPFSPEVKLGVMIEIPALALMADQVAEEADFASIGTNDLTQYLVAADRGEPSVAEYYQMYHPAVFRLIRIVSKSFSDAGKPLCVCGELGGDPLGGLALLGLGVRRFSMGASALAAMKRMICGVTLSQAREAAKGACLAATAEEAERILSHAAGTYEAASI